MITLEDWARQTNDAMFRDMAEMLCQPNPFLDGYEPKPRTFMDRVTSLKDRIKDALDVLAGRKIAVSDDYD